MKNKVSVLMVGPFTKTGGVATHTKSLKKAMGDRDLNLLVYNSSFEGEFPKIVVNIIKIYKCTFGMFWFSIKRRKSFEIAHTQSSGGLPGFLNAITGVIVSSAFRKKLIVTFHHGNAKRFMSKHKKIVKFVFNRADRFILVSNSQKKSFAETFSNTDKIRIIPNGFDSNLFYPISKNLQREKLMLPTDKKIILSIGNLVPEKGHKHLIRAMEKIVEKRKDTLLIIIGSGHLKRDLENQTKNLNLQDYVRLVRLKPHSEIPLWMNACDVFVLPSLVEGNPTVMFECLGCGKPFVGTNVGGIPDVITNEKLGIIVEPKDVEGLTKAILKALDTKWDKDYILSYAKQFTWEKIAEKIMEVYDGILEKG